MSAFGTAIQRVPVQYITGKHIEGGAYDVKNFFLNLCGGCKYDNQTVVVMLILQQLKWDLDKGDFLNATVMSDKGDVIATNEVGDANDHEWVATFNFKYFKSYGNLKFKVVNGPGPGMMYTMAVMFENNNEIIDCENRWTVSYIETRGQCMQQVAAVTEGEGFYELVPMFMTTEQLTVATNELEYLQLDYCFPNDALKYKLFISVIATDGKSAFATYACPAGVEDCKTFTAPFSDTSASAANFVSVSISGPENVGPVTVIVRGDGRLGEKNKFTLAASRYFEE